MVMGKVSELLLLLQTCVCGRNWEGEGFAHFAVSRGSGCQQWMLTVAVLNQTVLRFWRWRECAFRARAVTWKEAGKALTTLAADDTWVRGSMKQKMVAGSGLSGLVGCGRRKRTLCVFMWPSLCYESKRRGRRESPQAFEPGKLKHREGRQVQLVFGIFSAKTAVWEGHWWVACELSILSLADAPGEDPFPCQTAVCGYQQHERALCRETRTASPWLFLGTRSITALAQPQIWVNLACLATRLIQLGGEWYLEAVLLFALDLPWLSLPSSASCCGDLLSEMTACQRFCCLAVSTGSGG